MARMDVDPTEPVGAPRGCHHDHRMDFDLPPELAALAADARAVGEAAASRRDRTREDGWLVGVDRAFALELAERGWLGMTWPKEVGGGGRSALERFVVFEALISEGAP